MLEKPNISDTTIRTCLHDAFGLPITQITFLPIGWVHNAAYQLTAANGDRYFLKLRRGTFNQVAVAVPAFLHAQGIQQVMTPIATKTQALWVHAHDFDWILYPFFDGKTGFATPLSKTQWIALGQSLKAIHPTPVPTDLAKDLPQESYSPRWRDSVKALQQRVEDGSYPDPIAASLAAFWQTKQDEIQLFVERAEQLAQRLQQPVGDLVICHTDLHAGNVLVGEDNTLTIVDWDEPLLARKERDLLFIGGGIGGIWNTDQESAWFYQGYGPTEIDLVALSYYRYERIIVDIAEVAERIFGQQGSVEERQKGLALIKQFLSNNVVEIAHRTYRQLS